MDNKNKWVKFKDDLDINGWLFEEKGIVLIKPRSVQDVHEHDHEQEKEATSSPRQGIQEKETTSSSNNVSFIVGGRTFDFTEKQNTSRTKSRASHRTKAIKLASSLAEFPTSHKKILPSKEALETLALTNKEHPEETFIPFVVKAPDGNEKELGWYIYPWLSAELDDYKFNGIDYFVTSGCMFGSSMKVKTNLGTTYEILKHNPKFLDGEYITDILFNSEGRIPHQDMTFKGVGIELEFMKGLKTPGKNPAKLLYHVPSYDYMLLIGIDLLISGRITRKACSHFLNFILKKKKDYFKEIIEIGKANNVQIELMSPFDNLFEPFPTTKIDILDFICRKLEIEPVTVSPSINPAIVQENRKKLISRCLEKLQTNTFNEEHRAIWQKLLSGKTVLSTQIEQVKSKITHLEGEIQVLQSSNATVLTTRKELTRELNYELGKKPPKKQDQDKIWRLKKEIGGFKLGELNNELSNAAILKIKKGLMQELNYELNKPTEGQDQNKIQQLKEKIGGSRSKSLKRELTLDELNNKLSDAEKKNQIKIQQLKKEISDLEQEVGKLKTRVEVLNPKQAKQRKAYYSKHYVLVREKKEVQKELLRLQKASDTLFSFEGTDDLASIGNAMPIALAANRHPNYKTCSLLPASEKPIQNSYVQYSKFMTSSSNDHTSTGVVNITTLEPIISAYPQSKGLLFYTEDSHKSISKLIVDKNILEVAAGNVAAIVQNQPVKPLVHVVEKVPKVKDEYTQDEDSSLSSYAKGFKLMCEGDTVVSVQPEATADIAKPEATTPNVASSEAAEGSSSPPVVKKAVKVTKSTNGPLFDLLKQYYLKQSSTQPINTPPRSGTSTATNPGASPDTSSSETSPGTSSSETSPGTSPGNGGIAQFQPPHQVYVV